MGGAQQGQHTLIGVVEEHPHQGDQVGTGGQRIGEEAATECLRAIAQTALGHPQACPFGHRRQIEEHQLEARCTLGHGGQKGAIAATDIEDAAMAMQRIGLQDLLGDQRLRGAHQFRVIRNPLGGQRLRRRLRAGVGIGPVAGHLGVSALAAQQ